MEKPHKIPMPNMPGLDIAALRKSKREMYAFQIYKDMAIASFLNGEEDAALLSELTGSVDDALLVADVFIKAIEKENSKAP